MTVQFSKISQDHYITSDPLYMIKKTEHNTWIVFCLHTAIIEVDSIAQAKEVIRAIKTVLFYGIKIDHCI